jgi:hypothetical protein
MNNQRPHVVIILGLALFFYLASALSSMLFARHWMATDCLNPVALDYFRSLMLVSLAMLDPHAGATPLRVTIPEQTESQ